MIDHRLRRQLEEVARRHRRVRAATWLAAAWVVLATFGAILLSLNRSLGVYFRGEPLVFAALGVTVTVILLWLSWRAARDPRWLARRIEDRFPQLDARLLTAIEQVPELPDGRYGYLQQELIQEALSHGYRHDWRRSLPAWRYATAFAACGVAACAIALSTLGLFRFARPTPLGLAPLLEPWLSASPQPTKLLAVEPGDVSIERGTSLLVLARFDGQPPAACDLLLHAPGRDEPQQVPMPRSLDDPVFGGRVASVDQDGEYQVRFDASASPRYRITVFDYPTLLRTDAQLDFPAYTSLETTTVQDVRHITAVEGTELTLMCHLNKPVVTATLLNEAGEETSLQPAANDPRTWQASMTLRQSQRWTLHLVDDADRRNKQPPEFVLTVKANQYPTVELASPARDVEVSPLEELQLTARVWDDYGLTRYGLTYHIGDGSEREVVLGKDKSSKDKITVEHLVQFEELSLAPAQLFAYHFWAEDQTADGQTRRAVSNLYFAEVRPFDESYRQGQQPAGGAPDEQQSGQTPGGEGSQAQQLAEEQKNIINATWNLLRTELSETISPTFVDDVRVIRESQAALINKLQELAQQVQDETAQSHAGKVADHMQDAVTQLTRAIDGQSRDTLREALSPEQAAYQALLKLRAREHEVVRSQSPAQQQSRSGSGSGSSRSQQQLQQLALSNDQNRYETERQARQQSSSGSEDRQVLNRLRELARRQSDLNERLKELQAELQQAQTEPEREELRKQLKRLREQQEEILRDTDELNSRVQNNPNQSELSETQQRLEQAHEEVRRASQALEKGQVSQALTSGSRAQRELDEPREEFRRRTSDRFADQARELTRQAQELAEAEQQVAEILNQKSEEQEQSLRSLRENSPREQVLEELQRQDERLEDLLQNMQTAVKESEQPQPLLAEQLYDSFRRARQDRLPENLQETRQSLQRGLVEDVRATRTLRTGRNRATARRRTTSRGERAG